MTRIYIRFITFLVIITFLCHDVALARGESNHLAPASEASELIPKPSRSETIRRASERIERMERILERVKAGLLEKPKEKGEIPTKTLKERLMAFFSRERAEEIIRIKEGPIPEIPLQTYLEDMKFTQGQAEEVSQCMDELIANALDAVLTRYFKKDTKTIGRFGLGALQVFGELLGEDEMIVLKSRKEGSDILNTFLFYKKGGQIVVKKDKGPPRGFEEGTSFTIVKGLDNKEREARIKRIRDGFCINTSARIYINTGDPPGWRQLNDVSGYDYLNCDGFKEINNDVNPVKIRINRYGYQIRDTGNGMSGDEIINNLLCPHTGTKGIKSQTEEERNRETGLFSKGVGTIGAIYVRLNGRLIGKPITAEGAEVSRELHFIFPHSARILSDWKRLEMDPVAIASLKNLCDKLTSTEPDYARLQCLVCLLNEYQPIEERGNIPKSDNLMEYLKKKTAELIRKKRPRYILPNIPGWEDIISPGNETVYLSPDIYNFSDKDLSWMQMVVPGFEIKEGLRIFLADFKEASKKVFLTGENKDGEYLVIDRKAWEQYKDTELLKEIINNLYPFQKVPAVRKAVRLKPYTPILVAMVMILALIFGIYGFKKPEHPSVIESRPVIEEVVKKGVVQEKAKEPITPPHSLSAAKIDSEIPIGYQPISKGKSKKIKGPRPKKALKVHNPGVRIGPEDRYLVSEIFGLGTDGQTILDKDAEFRPKGRKIDQQDIHMWVVVKPWDVIKLPIGRNGIIDPSRIAFMDAKNVWWGLDPLIYGKYIRIPEDVSGEGRISYWGDIYSEVDIANLDKFPLSEQERIDASEFFGPLLAKALGVTNLDEARKMPDKMKDRAIQRVMHRIFKYDDRKEYSWNGRSWSSLAREKTRNGKRKMGLVCNGSATYYYIMAKILGMEVALVDAESLKNLSYDEGHVLVYIKINGRWGMRETTEYVKHVHFTILTGDYDAQTRLKVKYDIPLPNQEMLDASEFFGPILVSELNVKDLATARNLPDARKDEAIRNVLKRLFTVTGQSECYWNNRSWSSLAKEKTEDGKEKMAIDSNDTKTYYYIMAKLLGMDVKLITWEKKEIQLSSKPEWVDVYRNVTGKWQSDATDQPEKPPGWIQKVDDNLTILADKLRKWTDRIDFYINRIRDEIYGWPRNMDYGFIGGLLLFLFLNISAFIITALAILIMYYNDNLKRLGILSNRFIGSSLLILIFGINIFLLGGLYSLLAALIATFSFFFVFVAIGFSAVSYMVIFKDIVKGYINAENNLFIQFNGTIYLNGEYLSNYSSDGDIFTNKGDLFLWYKYGMELKQIIADIFSKKRISIKRTYSRIVTRHGFLALTRKGGIYRWHNGKLEFLVDGRAYLTGSGEAYIYETKTGRFYYLDEDGKLILQDIDISGLKSLYFIRDNVIYGVKKDGTSVCFKKIDEKAWQENTEWPASGIEDIVYRIVKDGLELEVVRVIQKDGKIHYFLKTTKKSFGEIQWFNAPLLSDRYQIEVMDDWVFVLSGDGIAMYDSSGHKGFVKCDCERLFKYKGRLFAVKRLLDGYELLEIGEIDKGLFSGYGLVKSNLGLREGEEWYSIKRIMVGEDTVFIAGLAKNKRERTRVVYLRNFKEYSFEDTKINRRRNWRKRREFRITLKRLLEQNQNWYKRLLERQIGIYKNWSPVHLFTAYIVDRHDISEETITILEVYLKDTKDSIEAVERFMLLASLILKYAGDERGREMISNLIRWKQNDPKQLGIMIDKLLTRLVVSGKTICAVKGIKDEDIFNKLPEEYQMYVGVLQGREEWLLKEEVDDSIIKGKPVNEMQDRNLADVIYAGRTAKEEIRDLNDLMARLSQGTPSGVEYERIMKAMLGSVTAQDIVAMFFIRELYQNSRDEMRTKGATGKIEIRSYLNNNRWILSVSDSCGMNLDRIVKYLFPPGKTTKKPSGVPDEELERVFAGVFGWGFYTIFADCSEVCIRTTLNGRGYEIRLMPLYTDGGDRRLVGITLLEAKEYAVNPEEHGTVIQRIKYVGEYSLFSVMLEHARAKRLARLYIGALDNREVLSEIIWDNGKRHILLMTSGMGIERITVDELYIQEIEEIFLAMIPYPWLRELVHKNNHNLEFDVNTDVTVIRRGLRNPKQYQEKIRDLIYQWVVKGYREGEISIPGLPPYKDFINNPFIPIPLDLNELLNFSDGEHPSLLYERSQTLSAELPQWIEERKDRIDIRSAINRYAAVNTTKGIIQAVIIGVMRGEIILTGKDREDKTEFMSQLVDAENKIDDDRSQDMLDKQVGISINTGEYDCLMALREALIELYRIILEGKDRTIELKWDLKEATGILDLPMHRMAIDIVNHIPDPGERTLYLTRLLNSGDLWERLRQRIIDKYGREKLKESIDELRGFVENKRSPTPSIVWTVSLQKEDCYKDELPDMEMPDEDVAAALIKHLRKNGGLPHLGRLGGWYRNGITLRTFYDKRNRLSETARAYLKSDPARLKLPPAKRCNTGEPDNQPEKILQSA